MRRESSFPLIVGLCSCRPMRPFSLNVVFFCFGSVFTSFNALVHADLETQTLMWIESAINNVAEKGGVKKRYSWRLGGSVGRDPYFPLDQRQSYDRLYISAFKRAFRTVRYIRRHWCTQRLDDMLFAILHIKRLLDRSKKAK